MLGSLWGIRRVRGVGYQGCIGGLTGSVGTQGPEGV